MSTPKKSKSTRLQIVPKTKPPVKSADVLKKVENKIGTYVAFAEPEMHLFPATLFTILTHCFEAFSTVPYLMVSAGDINCGKSLLLDVMASLSYPSQYITDASPATMYEYTDAHRGSLYLDEFEAYRNNADAMRIFNGGYKRGGCVTRKRGKEWVKFNTYSPKAFGLIGHLYRPLMSRCICLFMERGKPAEEWIPSDVTLSEVEVINPLTLALRNELHDLVISKLGEIKKTVEEFASNHPLLNFLQYRERELWKPLFILCIVLAPNRLEELTECAEFLSQRKRSRSFQVGVTEKEVVEANDLKETTFDLISDIGLDIMADRTSVGTNDLILLVMHLPRWRAFEDKKGQHIDTTQGGMQLFSRMMRPHSIAPKVLAGGKRRGYTKKMFLDALQKADRPTTKNPVIPKPSNPVTLKSATTLPKPRNPVTRSKSSYGVTESLTQTRGGSRVGAGRKPKPVPCPWCRELQPSTRVWRDHVRNCPEKK